MSKLIKPLNLFVFFVFIFFTNNALFPQAYDPEQSLAEIENSMEENLTWNLRNALALYFPETKFVIKANVELRKVVLRNPLPVLPDALLNKELKNLPGLPYVPEKLGERRARTEKALSLYQQVQKNNYAIRRIRVNLLLDRSFSEDDRAFIQRYVSVAADINRGRGDQVRIESLSFPARAEFSAALGKSMSDSLQGLPLTAATTKKNVMDWLPLALAALLGVLLLAALYFGLRSISKKLNSGGQPTNAVEGSYAPGAADSEVINWSDVTRGNGSVELSRLKSETIDTIVGTPAVAAKVLQQWIDQKENAGAHDVAIVLGAASKPLLDLLAPYLDSDTVTQIQGRINKLTESEIREKAEPLLRKFDQDIRTLALKTRQHSEEEDALAFLNHMTDDQLQHLLKPLKSGVQAIVLAQLRPNRAAKILNKLAPDERKVILAAMGDIERIPVDVYQHLARQLATKAKEIEKMRYVRANGVDSLVKVLDYFDDETQAETISYLQTKNMDLANKVTQRFMTFNQLFDLPENRIREIALEVDRELFAKSLVKVSEDEVDKIVQALPDKLGELVQASLEANQDLTEHEVSRARRSLMRSIREKQALKVSYSG